MSTPTTAQSSTLRPPYAPALERARTQGLTITRVEPSKWLVDSYSTPGTCYEVYRVGPFGWQCTCPAGQNGRPCKHTALAQEDARQGAKLADLGVRATDGERAGSAAWSAPATVRGCGPGVTGVSRPARSRRRCRSWRADHPHQPLRRAGASCTGPAALSMTV